jgi:hypothetical protein
MLKEGKGREKALSAQVDNPVANWENDKSQWQNPRAHEAFKMVDIK